MKHQYVFENVARSLNADTNALRIVIMENVEIVRARFQSSVDVEKS